MPRIKEQAICIRHIDFSETSQVVALLTENQGKIRGLAKGSKRTSPSATARFSGGIELLTLGQVVGNIKPTTELVNITEWDLQQPFHFRRTDLPAEGLAMFAADVANALVEDREPHPRCFHVLSEYLEQLAIEAHRPAALLHLQWTLLDDCGYRPELDADVATGELLETADAYTFDPQQGGLTMQRDNGVNTWQVRLQTVNILRELRDQSPTIPDTAEAFAGRDDALQRANRLLCVYLRALLDRELPTMHFVLND